MTVCINLIPADIVVLRRVNVRRKRWIAAGAAVAALGLVVSLGVRASLRDPRGLADELTRATARRDAAALDVDRARSDLMQANQRLIAVGGLADRPNWSILLAVIAKARLDSTVVDALTLKKAPPTQPPPGSPPGSPPTDDGAFVVTIKGRAENQRDISTLARGFEKTELFDSVRQERVQSVKTGDRELLEFEFTCRIGPRSDATPGPDAGGSAK
ncbi:MAG: hypothetical protein IT435_16205 [Phycisphaerales bacterium]|nr:hypothetical protein [Phycisphaerales bacterium]